MMPELASMSHTVFAAQDTEEQYICKIGRKV